MHKMYLNISKKLHENDPPILQSLFWPPAPHRTIDELSDDQTIRWTFFSVKIYKPEKETCFFYIFTKGILFASEILDLELR